MHPIIKAINEFLKRPMTPEDRARYLAALELMPIGLIKTAANKDVSV